MARSKEADLTNAVLLYAVRCLAEGDQQALRQLNFGTREVEALRNLDLTDLHRIATVHGHCLDVQLNRESYWLIVEHLRRERETEALQHALIRADAPFELMQALFGLDSRTYTGQRNLAGVRPASGRPPIPDEETSHRLWQAWADRLADVDEAAPTATDYLAVHEETGIPVRAIWQLTQGWLCTGQLPASGGPSGDPASAPNRHKTQTHESGQASV